MSFLDCKTELRRLNQIQRNKIEHLLNEGDSWRELIMILPDNLESFDVNGDESIDRTNDRTNDRRLLIDNEKIQLLEKQKQNGSPSKALIDYWSTYGMVRPTIEHLIFYASECKLYRLVDYLITELVDPKSIDQMFARTKKQLINRYKFEKDQNDEIEHQMMKYLNSKSNISDEKDEKDEKFQFNLPGIRTIDYELIRKYTNNFNDVLLKDGGNKVGEGGFGIVYLAKLPRTELNDRLNCEIDHTGENYLIAVKVVSNEFREQFNSELSFLTEYRHPNLLNLIGVSCWSDSKLCILSEYMINNSLRDCLLSTNIRSLDYTQRIKIIGQIIDAIFYLHTAKKEALIHRDLTSSNILMDRNFNAKICDFGLARIAKLTNKTINTVNIIGTSVYMAPESFRGKISVKTDTFSFGIVLLEILTGLPPIEEDNDDILTFVNENIFRDLEDLEENEEDYDQDEYERKIIDYLDKKAGNWDQNIGIQLFDLARKSTNDDKNKRPTMIQIKEIFDKLIKNSN